MDNLWEKLKDIFYDGTDYIIMLVTIVIVVLIINWRIGGLFKRTEIGNSRDNPVATIDEEEESPTSNLDSENIQEEESSHTEKEEKEDKDGNIITVNIPTGSLPNEIGEILESNGLVNSKEEFINKTIEMGMDTSLKSGSFQIPDNSSIEDIISIISK